MNDDAPVAVMEVNHWFNDTKPLTYLTFDSVPVCFWCWNQTHFVS